TGLCDVSRCGPRVPGPADLQQSTPPAAARTTARALAEGVGFEPTRAGSPPQRFSRPSPSAARTALQEPLLWQAVLGVDDGVRARGALLGGSRGPSDDRAPPQRCPP